MEQENYTTSFLVDETPQVAYKAALNMRGWWSEQIDGNPETPGEVFTYHYKDMHYCKMKLVELVPNERIVWLVLDNYFKFTEDKTEWTGTQLVFDITPKNGQTEVRFTHEGLVPQYECYEVCREAWTNYAGTSLHSLITEGAGQPNVREENNFNEELIAKWKLEEKSN